MVRTSMRMNGRYTACFRHEFRWGLDHSHFSSLRQPCIVRLSPSRVNHHSDDQAVPSRPTDLCAEGEYRAPVAEADGPSCEERLHPHPSTLDSCEAGKACDIRSRRPHVPMHLEH